MPDWRVPLADVEIGEAEIAAVSRRTAPAGSAWGRGPRSWRSGSPTTSVSTHAIAVTNGTAALHLICLAAGLGPGRRGHRALADVRRDGERRSHTREPPRCSPTSQVLERPWLSAKAVAAAIGTRTRAIMNMTYGGHPGASAALAELAAERGLILLEDAAHGLGGSLGGQRLGTFGLAGAFSFFSNKNLPVGEGGMVVTDDDEIAAQVRLLRSHGMTSLTWDRHRGHASGYDVVDLGFNYRIDEPRAAMALQRLSRLDADNARRATAAAAYRAAARAVFGAY